MRAHGTARGDDDIGCHAVRTFAHAGVGEVEKAADELCQPLRILGDAGGKAVAIRRSHVFSPQMSFGGGHGMFAVQGGTRALLLSGERMRSNAREKRAP